MAADPTAQTVTLFGGDGFVNAETALNNIGAIYGKGKGAISGRSIKIEDVEQFSNNDKIAETESFYKKYGETESYTSGKFYKEITDEEGNITGYETIITEASNSNPVKITNTYYQYDLKNYIDDSTIYNMFIKNSADISKNKSTYWLASRSIYLSENGCGFFIQLIGGTIGGNPTYFSYGANPRPAWSVIPVISLNTSIQTTGQDDNKVWQLKID